MNGKPDERKMVFIGHADNDNARRRCGEIETMLEPFRDQIDVRTIKKFDRYEHLRAIYRADISLMLIDPDYVASSLFPLMKTVAYDLSDKVIIPVVLRKCTWKTGFFKEIKPFWDTPLEAFPEAGAGSANDAINELAEQVHKRLESERHTKAEALSDPNSADEKAVFLTLETFDEGKPLIVIWSREDDETIHLTWDLPLPQEPDEEDLKEMSVRDWERLGRLADDLYDRFRDAYISLELSDLPSTPDEDSRRRVVEARHILACAWRQLNEFLSTINTSATGLFRVRPLPALRNIDKCLRAIEQNLPEFSGVGTNARRYSRLRPGIGTSGGAAPGSGSGSGPAQAAASGGDDDRMDKVLIMMERVCAWMLQLVRYSHRVHHVLIVGRNGH
jgi:hypothetical protein